jgi:hypothetical protein
METIIVFLVSQIVPGAEFMWNEAGNKTFTIQSVVAEPQASFVGNKLAPYAWVQWSDEDKPSTMNLASIVSGVRSGQILPPVD